MALSNWMSWEGGVDFCGMTAPGLAAPNVVVHVARLVHTPVGSAPAGMIFWQPDPAADPMVAAFVSADERVGGYFGPRIFAGTPFEKVPALRARITITVELPEAVSSRVEVAGRVFEVRLSGLSPLGAADRAACVTTPFRQMGLEAVAARAALRVDGREIALTLPPVGISGGPAAVWAPAGIYAR